MNMDINRKKQAELLSPAGSLETLKAVAIAGADAVYAAGQRFGARAYANNLSEEELKYAIDYLHLHGKKLYLTVNTLLKEEEIKKELYQYILPLYEQGLDGVIVQDLGVLSFLRKSFPGLELHASTQMTITGSYGAKLLKDMGCSRVVPARELSFSEIRRIKDEVGIEIESFIHGALCYCYSGQCLFSSMLGGRSGNRGRCAQPCRLPYQTTGTKDAYVLSPKDLCTIEILPQILESGVYSLKIEGRMKQAEYAAGVTSIYREYLDRYLLHPQEPYEVDERDLKRLMELGSRSGFTKGYYQQKNGPDMMTMKKPAHTKSNDALQEEMRNRFLKKEIQEKIHGILKLSKETPAELVIRYGEKEISVTGELVQKSQKRPLEKANIEEKMKKTGGSGFSFETLQIQMEEDIFLPISALNQLRREGLERLEQELLHTYRRKIATDGLTETTSVILKEEQEKDREKNSTPYLAVAVHTRQQAELVKGYSYVNRIYIDSSAFSRETEIQELSEVVNDLHNAGKEVFYQMPPVLRQNTVVWYETYGRKLAETNVDGFVTGSLEAVGILKQFVPDERIHADANLYVYSSYAAEALKELGLTHITLPLEANERELKYRNYEGGELIIYGYLPLMVSAQCLVKNTGKCTKIPAVSRIKDRYAKTFSIKNQCKDCYNVIYNSSPLSLLHQEEIISRLSAEGYRISFTIETPEEIRKILALYEKGFLKKEKLNREHYLKDFTNGHFKRGVE